MFSHIKTGVAVVLRNKKMVALFYFSNLLIGFLFILPFRAALSQFLGSSRMAENLHHFIDLTFLAEFFKTNGAVMGQLGLNLSVLAPLYFLLMLFLSGGAFALFVRGGGWPEQFWANSAAFFWRFVRLFLWSLPVLSLVFVLPWLGSLVQKLIHGDDPYQWVGYYWARVKIILAGLATLYYHLVFDYARIIAVSGDERNMRKTITAALRFVHSRLFSTAGISLVYFSAGIAGMAIYYFTTHAFDGNSTLVVTALFLLSQAYIIFRTLIKLGLYAAESSFYSAALVPAASEELPFAGEDETGLAEATS
ncbi:MAG TPA: hypothetical protein ENJ29_04050 [Bacteroidetes bacterium]|nr:hypothetical protein [Bacteroidota bacterium]